MKFFLTLFYLYFIHHNDLRLNANEGLFK
ncbi:hypothetical protein THIX_10311 [Thiomonas sp. X19]|nr:hypothetical protein THIX_10311 [Thiomonas sp. X19]